MEHAWSAQYRDGGGEVNATLLSDGTSLRLRVRGVEFRGIALDDFRPLPGTPPEALKPFTLSRGDLCGFSLRWEVPLPVVVDRVTLAGALQVALEVGPAGAGGFLEFERVRLTLRYDGREITTSGRSGWFEDEQRELQTTLGRKVALRTCFGCAHSDYSPYGHGLFGTLACFRGARDSYRRVRSKYDLFELWEQRTEFVQETHTCDEWERRPAETGYRG